MGTADANQLSTGVRPTLGRIVLGAAIVLVVWALAHVLLVIFFAVLLALIIRGAADWLAARLHAPPRLMLAVVTLAIVVAGAGLVYWIGPRLIAQSQDLVTRLTAQAEALVHHFNQSTIGKNVGSPVSSVGDYMFGTARTALGIGFTTTVDLVVIAVTTIYLAADPMLYVRGVLHVLPQRHRARTLDIMFEIAHVLRLWVLGQLVDMVTVGAMSAVGLALLGVPAPYALAVLAGLLTFIPYLGAIAAGVPAVLVALTVSWTTALWAVGIYTACHFVEGYLLAPLVQRRLIDLPPALTILGMTVVGALFGVLGVILGTPLAAVVLVLVRELWVKDTLRDQGDAGAGLPVLWKQRLLAPQQPQGAAAD